MGKYLNNYIANTDKTNPEEKKTVIQPAAIDFE